MPPRHWSRAWQRVTFLKLLSGLTLPPSTVEAGAASWIASLRATRASPTASPESEPAPPTIASLSTRCFASSTKAGRFVSSAKTSLGTPTGNSPPLSDHWKQWATALRQESSARPKLAPATAATDCSSWPTPRTITGGPETAQRKQELGRLESGGGRPAVGGACGELVDAASERRGEGRPEHELRSGWHTAADSGSGLADAGGAGREGCEFRRACDDDRDRAAASGPASELCGTLLLAPGPGDARWAEILAGSPGLEPAICRMADGLAHRVDRLRAGGNGVVSLAAARAWLALDALHADARTAAGVAAVKAAA
jgi:hypothetical protein